MTAVLLSVAFLAYTAYTIRAMCRFAIHVSQHDHDD